MPPVLRSRQEVSEENSVQTLEEKGFFPKESRLPVDISQTDELVPYEHAKPAFFTQIRVLLARERLSILRFPLPFLFTLSVSVFLCVLSGILFLGVGAKPVTDDGVVSGILGSVVNTMLLTMMLNAGIINASVIYEKQLFLREYATDHYAVVSFMTTKFIVESLQTMLITLVAVRRFQLLASSCNVSSCRAPHNLPRSCHVRSQRSFTSWLS
jgi:ABC-2 type transporter